jgi:hypothetical protein
MSEGQAAVIVWAIVGLIGGLMINRVERIVWEGWFMSAILGPLTLFLGIWEWVMIKNGRYRP